MHHQNINFANSNYSAVNAIVDMVNDTIKNNPKAVTEELFKSAEDL